MPWEDPDLRLAEEDTVRLMAYELLNLSNLPLCKVQIGRDWSAKPHHWIFVLVDGNQVSEWKEVEEVFQNVVSRYHLEDLELPVLTRVSLMVIEKAIKRFKGNPTPLQRLCGKRVIVFLLPWNWREQKESHFLQRVEGRIDSSLTGELWSPGKT